MINMLKVSLAAAALVTVSAPLLSVSTAYAAPGDPACKNGVVVDPYRPTICKPTTQSNGGGGNTVGNGGNGGGGVVAGNGGGNGGGSVGGGGSLPFTGADILAMSVGGGVLVAVGGGALVAGRRRRTIQIA